MKISTLFVKDWLRQMHLVEHTPKIWTIEGFLNSQRCTEMIEWSEQKGYQPASVTTVDGPRMMSRTRNNDRLIFDYMPLADELYGDLNPFLPTIDDLLPNGMNERFRFYRYGIAQRFKRHRDGRVNVRGQESRITFMVYLNDDFSGGETKFDDVLIKPRSGMALMFIHELKHESLPIMVGTKYVLRSDVFYGASTLRGGIQSAGN